MVGEGAVIQDLPLSRGDAEQGATGLFPVNAGFGKFEPGYLSDPKVHWCYMVYYCVSGKGDFCLRRNVYDETVGGQRVREEHQYLNKGEFLIIPPYETVSFRAEYEQPWELIWLWFKGPEAERLRKISPLMRYDERTFFRVRDAVMDKIAMPELYLSLIYELFYHIFKTKNNFIDVCEWVDDYIRFNYFNDITVEEIAEIVGRNRRYLSQLYKEKHGYSIKEAIIRVRMENAKYCLQQGFSVAETASKVGYSDAFAFSKMFHKVVGCSPSAIREK